MSNNETRGRKEAIDRRMFAKLVATAGVGTLGGISGSSPVRADPCCGDGWPKTHDSDFSAPFSSTSDTTIVTSAGTELELIESTYKAGRWRFFFRTETDIGQINDVPDQPNAVGYNLNGDHKLEIEETVNREDLDSYHGSEERNFGVTGDTGPQPDWAAAVYNIGTAIVGRYDERVSDLITAASIINSFVHPGFGDPDPEGIFHDWTISGEGRVGNYLRWTTEYPPKGETGNDNHQIKFRSILTGIPDGPYSYSTSDYEAAWTVDLGSMYAPSSMSTNEKKSYGIERVHSSELNVNLAEFGIESTGPVYRAKNPPVTAVSDSE